MTFVHLRSSFVLALASYLLLVPQTQLPGTITLQAPKKPSYIGMVISPMAALTNTSTKPLVFRDGLQDELYDELDPSHKDLLYPVRLRNAGPPPVATTINVSAEVRVEPGQTLSVREPIETLGVVTHAGIYTLVVSGTDATTGAKIVSAPLELKFIDKP